MTKRVFVSERPAPRPPQWLAALRLRVRDELPQAIDFAEDRGVPEALCGTWRGAVAAVSDLVRLLEESGAKYARVAARQGGTRGAAEAGAQEAASERQHATPQDRQRFIESKTREIEQRANDNVAKRVVDELRPRAVAAARNAIEALRAAEMNLGLAEAELQAPDAFSSSERERVADFAQEFAGLPVASRMQWACGQLALAIKRGDQRVQRVIVRALSPMAREILDGGIARHIAGQHVSSLTPQQGAKVLDAARTFDAQCRRLREEWKGTGLLALAHEIQTRLVEVFRKTAGVDPSDPEILTRAQREHRGWAPYTLDEMAPIAARGDWLGKFYNRRTPLKLQPWTSFSPSPMQLDKQPAE